MNVEKPELMLKVDKRDLGQPILFIDGNQTTSDEIGCSCMKNTLIVIL